MAETYWERKLWEPDIETMPRKELRELQKKKLFPQLIYAYENAPFYKELYDKEKVDVYKIRTIEDFQKYVPIIEKEDVRRYRERTGDIFGGLLCLPLTAKAFYSSAFDSRAGRLHKSTGTTGVPTLSIFTENDMRMGTTIGARMFWRYGMRPSERVWIICELPWHPYVTFIVNSFRQVGVLLYMDNSFLLTAGIISSSLPIARRLDIETLVTTQTDHRALCQKLEQRGQTLKQAYLPSLQKVVSTGELAKSMREYYYKWMGDVPITDLYGVSEVCWLGGSCKEEGDVGMWCHMPEDTHFVEVLDPRTRMPVVGIEFGEPILTNLFYETMAFIRWRTEDFAHIRWDPCPYCGFTHIQCLIMGRESESVDVKGKLITMAEVEDIIYAHPESRPMPIQIIREEPQPQDKYRVRVCYNSALVKNLEEYKLKVAQELNERLGVDVEAEVITPEQVTRVYHKYVRVIKEKRRS